MTYRGIYRDGIVILQGDVDLRNGASVDVNATRAGKTRSRRTVGSQTKSRKGVKSGKSSTQGKPLSGFGIWKNRWPKSMSSGEIARQLRDQVSRRTK